MNTGNRGIRTNAVHVLSLKNGWCQVLEYNLCADHCSSKDDLLIFPQSTGSFPPVNGAISDFPRQLYSAQTPVNADSFTLHRRPTACFFCQIPWGVVARNLLLQVLVVYLMLVWRQGRVLLECIAVKIAFLFSFSREAAWVLFDQRLPHMLSIEVKTMRS